MVKSRLLLYLNFLVLALVLFGCTANSDLELDEDMGSIQEDVEVTLADDLNEDNGFSESEKVESSAIYHIYVSADQTGASESGESILMGIDVALSQVNYQLGGYPVKVISLDHHGNTARFQEHLELFQSDEKALVMYGGLHSPPILKNLAYINEEEILFLDPWAAAGPITRYTEGENWIYRLSIDDAVAGKFIADYTVGNEGYKKPYLILEDTGWGESNYHTMTQAIKALGGEIAGVSWFQWGIEINEAKTILREAKEMGADVLFFVGNAPEGENFAKAMVALDKGERLPIRSHWGIIGGDFPEIINTQMRAQLDLSFIQTSFSFLNIEKDSFGWDVFMTAKERYPNQINTPEDILAPTGFIHAYDMTRLLIATSEEVVLTGDSKVDKFNLKEGLENIIQPIEGLIKTYETPFTKYSLDNPFAHEALSSEEYRMARYGVNGEVILLEK